MIDKNFERQEMVSDAFEMANEVIEAAFNMIERKWPNIEQPPAEMAIGVANIIARFVK